ncbi:HNH endonuclease, partial [Salmonella enterica subsp. enterica serovar Infantis]|nr:HNH endonuclease [Salmonella enterica subsp. enterica serovar Infantis]
MKEVKIYTIVSDQLSPPITGESFCTDMVRHSDYAELDAKYAALADLFGDVKEILGFKYRYFISSKGLIFSMASGKLRQLNPSMRGKNRNQYLFVRLELEGELKGVNIHRLVAENFIGPKPSDEHVINHKDGNKQNNDASNLEWTTIAGNTQHAYRTGLAGGRKHG